MANLLLASKVKAELAADARTSSAEVEVRADADSGSVALKGKVRPASMVDAVVSVVRAVEGVKSIDRDYLDAPDYTV
jgi:osmotically-inducible protein OsmY